MLSFIVVSPNRLGSILFARSGVGGLEMWMRIAEVDVSGALSLLLEMT